MARHPALLLGCFAVLASASACHEQASPATPPTTDPGRTTIAARYDAEGIREVVEQLGSQLSLSPTQRVSLREKLDAFLVSDEFAPVMAAAGVQAVGVYRWGEGGVVVKIARGDGKIRFANVPGDRGFELEFASVGAQVGGSASWGVVLAVGLPTLEAIEGSYTGAVASATAIEENTGAVRLVHKDAKSELYFVGIAAGLSANAGEGKLVFALTPG